MSEQKTKVLTYLNDAKIFTKSGRFAVIDYIEDCGSYHICYLKNDIFTSKDGKKYKKIFLNEIELILEL